MRRVICHATRSRNPFSPPAPSTSSRSPRNGTGRPHARSRAVGETACGLCEPSGGHGRPGSDGRPRAVSSRSARRSPRSAAWDGSRVERASLLERKQEIVERYGDWTAHNVVLAEGISTLGDRVSGDEHRLRRVVQIVSDLVPRPIEELRVLDLACLEGLYSIEFAKRGAQVVGIEGREANVAKARFAKEALGLDSVEFIEDDVRDLSRDAHGEFDVVLCIGILYHLDAPDVFVLVERIADVCRQLAVIDTHVALSPRSKRSYGGREFRGISYVEHSAAAAPSERAESTWASLDNARSFWPTKPSLLNALACAGFTSVFECFVPSR